MKHEILAALAEVERQHAVRVLLAVESGSRAWGFPSQDSDYDVRFIYVHPRDWYLRIFEQRDVIEPESEGLLDPSGWELRKALRLFSKCNLALNEWLNSPIVYREIEGLRCQLQALIPAFFNPIAAIHHYLSMARTALEAREAGGTISTKKHFYALRALTRPEHNRPRRAMTPWTQSCVNGSINCGLSSAAHCFRCRRLPGWVAGVGGVRGWSTEDPGFLSLHREPSCFKRVRPSWVTGRRSLTRSMRRVKSSSPVMSVIS